MIRQLLSFFAFTVITGSVSGQAHPVVKEIQQLLHQKNFQNLEAKIKSTNGAYWETLREIMPGVQEGVLQFGYITKDTGNTSAGTSFSFTVNLLTKGDQIFYYVLYEEKYRQRNGEAQPYSEPLDSLRDQLSYDSMKMAFSHFYGMPLEETDLFQAGIVYGENCGFAGIPPVQRQTIDSLVKKRDQASLLKWLRSANTEKQVYAIDGLYQLKKAGIPLSKNDLLLIDFVINKKGSMQECSGCIFSSRKISEVTTHLRF